MPSRAPKIGNRANRLLKSLGARIKDRRRELDLSAVATAEAAGMSRPSLHRIEKGDSSVTIGAYLNVLLVLRLTFFLDEPQTQNKKNKSLPQEILISDYPELKKIAWQIKRQKKLTPEEALDLYERNWRHVDHEKLSSKERLLIDQLLNHFGRRGLV